MSEEQAPTNVSAMLRHTAGNYAQFMEQIAIHVDKLESQIAKLEKRILELEEAQDDFK